MLYLLVAIMRSRFRNLLPRFLHAHGQRHQRAIQPLPHLLRQPQRSSCRHRSRLNPQVHSGHVPADPLCSYPPFRAVLPGHPGRRVHDRQDKKGSLWQDAAIAGAVVLKDVKQGRTSSHPLRHRLKTSEQHGILCGVNPHHQPFHNYMRAVNRPDSLVAAGPDRHSSNSLHDLCRFSHHDLLRQFRRPEQTLLLVVLEIVRIRHTQHQNYLLQQLPGSYLQHVLLKVTISPWFCLRKGD